MYGGHGSGNRRSHHEEQRYPPRGTSNNSSTQKPQTTGSGGVNFHSAANQGSIDKLTQRERIITVRYGAHQMKLIRKRLAIEQWLDDELRKLYRCVSAMVVVMCLILPRFIHVICERLLRFVLTQTTQTRLASTGLVK